MATMGAPLWPSIRPYIEQTADQARAVLGDAGFQQAWTSGASLSVDQAVALAMALRDPPQLERRFIQAKRLHGARPLTSRELAVAHRIARGLTNKQIAAELVIAEGTADRHVANILGKLGFNSRAQIAAWAVEHGAPPATEPRTAGRATQPYTLGMCLFLHAVRAECRHSVHTAEEGQADGQSSTTSTFPVTWEDPSDAARCGRSSGCMLRSP